VVEQAAAGGVAAAGGAAATTAVTEVVDASPTVRELAGEDALRTMQEYATSNPTMKHIHEKVLTSRSHPSTVKTLVVESSTGILTGILVYTNERRGKIILVHVREDARYRGVGSMLGKHLLERVEHSGSFTVESPACTARAAVKLWLSLGFMGDSDLLECEIADDASYIGGRSVRLSFSWQRPETNPEARLAYLENVVRVHPEMATACERGRVA
jgi:hypothetical protein